jgi:APA family basic amino acid/polyamine antiporter
VTVRPEWIGTAALLGAGLMHGLRLREGVVLQNLAVGIKVVLIAGFVALGATILPDVSRPATPAPDFELGAFAVTLVWISFAYSGWNAAVYIAGEVRDPERNVKRSLLVATLAVTAIYLALNAIFLYAAPPEALAGKAEVGAVAAEALGGVGLRRLVSILVSIALFTSISSMAMAGPRVYAQMAEDGVFPKLFRYRAEVPRAAIALQIGLAIVVLWVSGLAELLGYIGFTLGLSAAATVAALIALRLREGADRMPVPGFPWIPGLFVITTLATATFMAAREPVQAALGLATALLGLPVYFLLRQRGGG